MQESDEQDDNNHSRAEACAGGGFRLGCSGQAPEQHQETDAHRSARQDQQLPLGVRVGFYSRPVVSKRARQWFAT